MTTSARTDDSLDSSLEPPSSTAELAERIKALESEHIVNRPYECRASRHLYAAQPVTFSIRHRIELPTSSHEDLKRQSPIIFVVPAEELPQFFDTAPETKFRRFIDRGHRRVAVAPGII